MAWVRQVVKPRVGDVRQESVLLNHYLRCLNHSNHGVTLFEFQFVGTSACDGAFNETVSHPYNDVRHYITQLDFLDFSAEFVSR
jgi:hypothetical protein